MKRAELALLLGLLGGAVALAIGYSVPRAKHAMDYTPDRLPIEFPPDR